MKLIRFYTAVILLFSLPFAIYAKNKWNTPDKGYFKYQKDIDATVSDYSRSMSTIYYHGKLFNFITYDDGFNAKIIVRKLSRSNNNNSWSMAKQDNIESLKITSNDDEYTPFAVVFRDTLLLFNTGNIFYYANLSIYNEVNDQWSPMKQLNYFLGAAVVAKDKLILIQSKGDFRISVSSDLVNWKNFDFNITNGLLYTGIYVPGVGGTNKWIESRYYNISAISKSWVDKNGNTKTKIMIAYLTDNQCANVAEFSFDDQDNLKLISNETVASEFKYSSVSIVDGSVKGDPTTDNTTQLFVKKAEKDNLYCRYRILRYQKVEGGSWTKQENNLVPQNYLWADKNLDINAVNFPTGDGKQLMCLVYRGYDDWDHPMNIAWAENTQPVTSTLQSKVVSNPVVGAKNNSVSNYPGENIMTVRNWPNPVTTTTTIQYKVVNENPETAIALQRYTTLSVYDIRGNLVKTLVNEIKSPGTYEVQWDASSLPAGIYMCKLLNGSQSAVGKMVVNK